MKHALHLIFCAVCTIFINTVNSQTVWFDSYSDSSFTQNPIWYGDTGDFIVNDSLQLQLFAPAITASKILLTPSTAIWDATWEFQLQFDFNPSSSNYARIHFASNQSLSNGYYVQVGGTTEDKIFLYKIENGQRSKLIESSNDWLDLNSVKLRVKISRDQFGAFTLQADTSNTYQIIGTAVDTSILHSEIFALECIYTSSRSKKMFFDDINVNGKTYSDSIPPIVKSALVVDSNHIQLTFSESLDSISATFPPNFLINSSTPTAINFLPNSDRSILIESNHPFQNKSVINFQIKNVFDHFGNKLKDTVITFDFIIPEWGDLLLSEIMFDPTPTVALPEVEFVEIYNPTSFEINLSGYKLVNGQNSIDFGQNAIKPNSFLVFTDSSKSQFFDTNSVGIYWPNGFLNNTGNTLAITNDQGEFLHYLDYSPALYSNPAKAEGGWSLENGLLNFSCPSSESWDGSQNLKGATPGRANSHIISENQESAFLKYLEYKSPYEIIAVFSTFISDPEFMSDLPISYVEKSSGKSDRFLIKFQESMLPDRIYNLHFNTAKDCSNLVISSQYLPFGIPKNCTPKDLALNEILFNPTESNTDFIEIVNTSKNCISLKDLRFAKINPVDNQPESTIILSDDSVIIGPGAIYVFSENPKKTKSFHNLPDSAKVLYCNLPSMPDNDGSIGICNASLQWIDQLAYSESWHHELIYETENVSLERVFLNNETQDISNWHSASYTVNFASPTQTNSQSGKRNAESLVSLSTDLITPNNDGLDDFVTIQFNMKKTGWVGSILVFDAFGRLQNTILENKPIGIEESMIWKGERSSNQLLKKGAYIIFIELWHPEGDKMIVKNSIVLHYD